MTDDTFDSTGVPCPECENGTIVYSGNYFCQWLGNGCDWAMPDMYDPRRAEPSQEMKDLFRRCFDGLMAHRAGVA
jgi:hypothetical protein